MIKKFKLLITAITMVFSMLLPTFPAFAAELSENVIELPQNYSRHSVIAFGKSITIIYPDGRREIIANNPSGRIDVMLDGKVTKGIGTVLIPSGSGAINMILENGSFIINQISEEQATSLKKMILDGLAKNSPVDNFTTLENQDELQDIKVFALEYGKLLKSDGAYVSADSMPGMEVKTTETAYEDFAKEQQEAIRQEQEAKWEEQQQEGQRLWEEARREIEASVPLEDNVNDNESNSDNGNNNSGNSGNGATSVCPPHDWIQATEENSSIRTPVLMKDGKYIGCVKPYCFKVCSICKMMNLENIAPEDYITHDVDNPEASCDNCGWSYKAFEGGNTPS